MFDFIVNWLANCPAFAVPYALAALGLIVSEKSGVLTLGAEGYLLMGAMAGAGALLTFGNHPELALAVAALATVLLSLVFAVMVVTFRVNQVIAGLTIVFLAQGLTSLIAALQGWTNRSLVGLSRLDLGPVGDIPVLGHVLRQDLVVYLTVPVFILAGYAMTRTLVGLRLRSVGDGPEAADAAGINVALYRYGAIAVGGALVGIAGAYLSVGVAKIWVDGMSGGRGWIAVALVIFARWQPMRALVGALLFGSIEALIPRVAAVGLQVPQYFMLMTPYVVTILVMLLTSLRRVKRYEEPLALGQVHLREERH